MRYEYECPGCGDVREIERKMTDPEETFSAMFSSFSDNAAFVSAL